MAFPFLRGLERENHRLYSTHTVWVSYDAFEVWPRSEAFRKAQARAGNRSEGMLMGSSEFERFEVVSELTKNINAVYERLRPLARCSLRSHCRSAPSPR